MFGFSTCRLKKLHGWASASSFNFLINFHLPASHFSQKMAQLPASLQNVKIEIKKDSNFKWEKLSFNFCFQLPNLFSFHFLLSFFLPKIAKLPEFCNQLPTSLQPYLQTMFEFLKVLAAPDALLSFQVLFKFTNPDSMIFSFSHPVN